MTISTKQNQTSEVCDAELAEKLVERVVVRIADTSPPTAAVKIYTIRANVSAPAGFQLAQGPFGSIISRKDGVETIVMNKKQMFLSPTSPTTYEQTEVYPPLLAGAIYWGVVEVKWMRETGENATSPVYTY